MTDDNVAYLPASKLNSTEVAALESLASDPTEWEPFAITALCKVLRIGPQILPDQHHKRVMRLLTPINRSMIFGCELVAGLVATDDQAAFIAQAGDGVADALRRTDLSDVWRAYVNGVERGETMPRLDGFDETASAALERMHELVRRTNGEHGYQWSELRTLVQMLNFVISDDHHVQLGHPQPERRPLHAAAVVRDIHLQAQAIVQTDRVMKALESRDRTAAAAELRKAADTIEQAEAQLRPAHVVTVDDAKPEADAWSFRWPWAGFYGTVQGGHVLTLAAGTGVGKSVCAQELANAALDALNRQEIEGDIVWGSVEMTVEEHCMRLACREMDPREPVPWAALVSQGEGFVDGVLHELTDDHLDHLREAYRERWMNGWGRMVFVGPKRGRAVPPLYAEEVEARVRQRQRSGRRVALVVLDYVQAMKAPPGLRLRRGKDTIDHIMDKAKHIATRYGVPVVVVSQLNRSAASAERPGVQHLKGSSYIEDISNVVLMLAEDDELGDANDFRYLVGWVVKFRSGVKGRYSLRMCRRTLTIDEP